MLSSILDEIGDWLATSSAPPAEIIPEILASALILSVTFRKSVGQLQRRQARKKKASPVRLVG